MNYTEIARKFNEENGRAMTYKESKKITFDGNLMTDIDDWLTVSAELFAESVRLEERRKVVDLAKKIIIADYYSISKITVIKDLESLKTE